MARILSDRITYRQLQGEGMREYLRGISRANSPLHADKGYEDAAAHPFDFADGKL